MTFFFGFTALFIYSFLLGTIFLNKSFITITEKILFSVIVSLWSTWIIVSFIQIFDFQLNHYIVLSVAAILLVLNFFKKNSIGDLNVTIFFTYFTICLIIFSLIVIFKSDYLPVFVHGDAVFSWNRWAWELYNNSFQGSAGYPIFWPGFWSLIYSSMGKFDNWIIPNLSQFILPIILIVSNFLYCEKKYLKFFYVNTLFTFFIILILSDRLFIGYMDAPLTILTYLSLSFLFLFQISKQKIILLLASLTIAIASVTKQQGFILPIFFAIFSFFHLHKKNINLKDFIIYNFISFLHILIFFLFFEGANLINIIFKIFDGNYGNMDHLKFLSSAHARENNNILYSFKILTYRTTIYPIIILLLLGSINLLYVFRKETNFFGVLCLIFACLGFYFFMKYGSYDDRNGWFIFPYLFFSAICIFNDKKNVLKSESINKFFNRIKFKIAHFGKFFIFVFSFLILIFTFFEKFIDFNYWQTTIQSNYGGTKNLSIKGKNFLENNKSCSKIITNWNILPYNYHLMPYFINLDKKDKFEKRILLLSSDSQFDHFFNQNKDCKEPDIWLLTQPFKKELIDSSKIIKISDLHYVKEK